MGTKNGSTISRREFARRAALASAAASLSPAELLTKPSGAVAAMQTTTAPPAKPSAAVTPQNQTLGATKLSPESQVEVDSRVQAIFAQYGSRLSDAQKEDLKRLTAEGQAGLDRLRAFATDNGDGPALYLKPLMERERKPPSKAPAASPKSSAAPKSS